MSVMCKIVEYDGSGDNIYNTIWNGYWYRFGGMIPVKEVEENVLYRGVHSLITRITCYNGKVISLEISEGRWERVHQQIHDLIEIEGLTPYDAFKVLCI